MNRNTLFASLLLLVALSVLPACGMDNYIAGERLTDQCVSYCAARVTCDTEQLLPSTYSAVCQNDCSQGELNDDSVELSPDLLSCALHYPVSNLEECGSFRNCVKIGGYRANDDEGGN